MRDKQNILRTAEKYVLEQKFSAAVGEYRKLLEIEPGEPTLLNIVGDLLVRQGKPQEALKNFQEVIEIYLSRGFTNKAIAMLKKVLWIAPQDIRARESLAELYQKQGLQFDAVREFRGLIDQHIESGAIERALHFLKKLGTISPNNADIPMQRAGLLESLNKLDQALNARLEALDCLRKTSDFQTFKSTLTDVLRQDPANSKAFDLLVQAGESNRTEPEVREILASHLAGGAPEYPVKLYLARAEERISRPREAARLYKDLIQAGHSDDEITEGLLRTDPESAYATTGIVFDDPPAKTSMAHLEATPLDWDSESSNASGGAGSGLFADFEAEVDELAPEDSTNQNFTFEGSHELALQDADEEVEDLSFSLEETQLSPPKDATPIASLDEAIQEVDFYLKLGFKEDAVKLIEQLLDQFRGDEAVLLRARKAGLQPAPPGPQVELDPELVEEAPMEADKVHSVFPDSSLFEDFESEMEQALGDLFEGGTGDQPDNDVLRYDVGGGGERPNSPTVHYDLGLAYKEMGLVEDALQEFLIAIDMLDDETAIPQKILYCSMLTNTCRQLGKTDDAVHWAREGLKISELRDFERRAFEYELGIALGERGDLQEAIRLFQTIQDRDSDYRDVDERLSNFRSRLYG